MAASAPAWPEPYLQPDRRVDCSFYAAAYVARCLGFPGVTAEQVKAWRAESGFSETHYAARVLGADMYTFWHAEDEGGEEARRPFWLGPRWRSWLEERLDGGWIAQVMVHRIAGMGHAAVVLGHSPEGALLMDPIYGHITEPWGWFLGPGGKSERDDWPGSAPDGRPFCQAHFIEGWYRMPSSADPRGCAVPALPPARERWELLCLSIGAYLAARTGLKIDFQIQLTRLANERFPGPRNPLGLQFADGRGGRVFAGGGDGTPAWPSRA